MCRHRELPFDLGPAEDVTDRCEHLVGVRVRRVEILELDACPGREQRPVLRLGATDEHDVRVAVGDRARRAGQQALLEDADLADDAAHVGRAEALGQHPARVAVGPDSPGREHEVDPAQDSPGAAVLAGPLGRLGQELERVERVTGIRGVLGHRADADDHRRAGVDRHGS